MNTKEAAAYAGLHYKTVLLALQDRRIAGYQIGRHWRVTRTDMDRWMRGEPPRFSRSVRAA